MEEIPALLNQLKIDRGSPISQRHGRWIASCAIAIAVAMAGTWLSLGSAGVVPVTLVTVEPASALTTFSRGPVLQASGYVVARRESTVSSKVAGKVVEVLIEEGQTVEQDQVIAKLDSSNVLAAVAHAAAELEKAAAAVRAAEAAFQIAEAIYTRNLEQHREGFISAQEMDFARATYQAAHAEVAVVTEAMRVSEAYMEVTRRNVEDMIIRAPFAGVVTEKTVEVGETISPVSGGGGFTRTGIGTLVDMESLEVEVDVSENVINRVHVGQAVTLVVNAYPDWKIAAKVVAIVPTADRARATVRVRIGLSERDERILPQMGVRAEFHDGSTDASTSGMDANDALLVPEQAIQVVGDVGTVFIFQGGAVARRRVSVGGRQGGRWTVTSGLTAGARLAVGDFTKLDDGARVHVETE